MGVSDGSIAVGDLNSVQEIHCPIPSVWTAFNGTFEYPVGVRVILGESRIIISNWVQMIGGVSVSIESIEPSTVLVGHTASNVSLVIGSRTLTSC